jgi:hypothetical protein
MYRIVTHEEVVEQTSALPDHLLSYYLHVLDVLELAPWSGEPYNRGRSGRRDAEVAVRS